MTLPPAGRTFITLLIGCVGAGLAWVTGFPAPFLTGPALAVTVATLAGLEVGVVGWLRNTVFVVLGNSIGQSVTPEVIAAAARWPVSLVCLAGMLFVIIWASRAMLVRFWRIDRTSALISGFPGHLTYVLGLSEAIRADLPAISVIQSVRVLALTLSVPVIVVFAGELPDVAAAAMETLDPIVLVLMLAAAAALGWLLLHARMPAAFLMGGLVVSAVLHGAGIVSGTVPTWMTVSAFVVLGSLIGTRFAGTSMADLRRSMAAGLAVTVVSVAIAAAFAGFAAFLTGFPVPTLLIAFAPGGLETMVAMSVLLGADPTFVAAHHISRLLMLTLIVPLFLIGKERN